MSDNLFRLKAEEMTDELVKNRRYFHENPELGTNLPKTVAFVTEKLNSYGLEVKEICPAGLVADISSGRPGKTILLRADMDALPMAEINDLPFKSKTDQAAHTCGHDLHTAMLLGAARLLSGRKDEIEGTVRLMFQPDEEHISGAKAMMAAGVLENPKVDAAMGLHVDPCLAPGGIMYNSGSSSFSADAFEIIVHGEGCHGSTPHAGVDPINVGVHIYLAFQELIAREAPPKETVVLTIGQFTGGVAANIIPSEVRIQGGLRTLNPELRGFLTGRIKEVATKIAEAYRAGITYIERAEVPSIKNDPALVEEMLGYIRSLDEGLPLTPGYVLNGSEDFACISEKVPSFWLALPAQVGDNEYTLHSPYVQFNEEIMPVGAAIYAQCAFNWLKNNR